MKLMSIITCPLCRHRKEEETLTDAWLYFCSCARCRNMLRPKEGDCCVFCSFGTEKCPPVQNRA